MDVSNAVNSTKASNRIGPSAAANFSRISHPKGGDDNSPLKKGTPMLTDRDKTPELPM